MCKHAAAVLYGVGSRLDDRPELLFRLRDVDAEDLVVGDMALPDAAAGDDVLAGGSRRTRPPRRTPIRSRSSTAASASGSSPARSGDAPTTTSRWSPASPAASGAGWSNGS